MSPPRDYIDPPLRLTKEEQKVWEYLNDHYAPFVVTDSFGLGAGKTSPPVRECSWWSLYATGLMCLATDPSLGASALTDKPHLNGYRQEIVDSFWEQRRVRLLRFQRFLERWRLSSRFDVQTPRETNDPGHSSATHAAESDDECVLWFHSFSSFADVQKYALRWNSNPHFTSPILKSHRLVISRGIDLICSELLANAFEHSGGASFFILAKLCSVRSALAALAVHRRRHLLTPLELELYQASARAQFPILQLAIGDAGVGFGRNERLQRRFEKESHSTEYTETELIDYALRPGVSTKDPRHVADEWARLVSQEHGDVYEPIVHGLSEVRIFIHEHGGHWTIHSNNILVDVPSNGGSITGRIGRAINGCLHYIQIPLASHDRPQRRQSVSLQLGTSVRQLIPLDVGSAIHNPHAPGADPVGLHERIARFAKHLLEYSAPESAVVVNLLALDDLAGDGNESEYMLACALIADTLHRVRDTIGVFLLASDMTKSLLRRFKSTERLFDRRVLAYLDLFDSTRAITVDCGEALKAVKELLASALDPWSTQTVLRSDHRDTWETLQQVQIHNSGLFAFTSLPSGDEAFDGRLKTSSDQQRRPLLLGTRQFATVAHRLRSSDGFLPWDERRPYWFRSTTRTTHLNLGRLVSADDFQADLVAWFAVAAHSLAADASCTPGSVVFVALLHPAIGVTQELLRTRFPASELLEISTLAELSPDSWQFLNVVGRRVICVADMVVTGATMTQLVRAVEYAGGQVIGALTILSVPNSQVPAKLFPFSECTESELKEWAPTSQSQRLTLRDSERRIVDANSQFTGQVTSSVVPLAQRTRALLESGSLVLSHRIFGRNHHTFPILVRVLLERDVANDVIKDLRRRVRAELGELPFVVLYPGESTISYLLRQNEDLFPPDRRIALVPSFSGYGKRRLRLDLNPGSNRLRTERRVLFVDDSLSSGQTERQAREAWTIATGSAPESWLTYVIVRRGTYSEPQGTRRAARPAEPVMGPGKYRVHEYCAIGPRAFSAGDCPFCVGLERVKSASRRTQPLHNRAADLLKEVVDLCKATPVEGRGAASLLPPDEAARFLMLATNPLWVSAYHLAHDQRAPSAGTALFVAFFAGDLSAYLSTQAIAGILADYSRTLPPDDTMASRRFIAALAVLPFDYSDAVVEPIVRNLLIGSNTTTAMATIALAMAQTDTLLSQFETAGMSSPERDQRARKLLARLEPCLRGAGAENPAIQPAVRVMELEVRAMSAPSGTAGIVQLARTLSALFYEGSHATLLLPQLDTLHPASLLEVRQQLINALDHLQSFAAVSDVFTPNVLADARERLEAAAASGNCEAFAEEARGVLRHWTRLRGHYFHSVRNLREQALRGLEIAASMYAGVPGSYNWFDVEMPADALDGWHVLGPDARHLRDHFTNLFTNTIKHAPPPFDLETIAFAASRRPQGAIARVGWKADEVRRELVITYTQAIPFRKQTPAGRGLMANTNALLNAFGGGITLADPAEDGSPPIVTIDVFVPVCATRMPLVLEVPR